MQRRGGESGGVKFGTDRPTNRARADTPKLQVVLDAIYANDAAVCAPHLATDGMDLTVVRMLKDWPVVMLRNNFNS